MGFMQSVKQFFVKPDAQKNVLNDSCFHTSYLVIDLELTGLNAKKDEIVSLAWVPVDEQRIQLGKSEHYINKQVCELKQSPIYHGIDHDCLTMGVSLEFALQKLNKELEDKVLVFHNTELDWAFLKIAFNKHGLLHKPAAMLDTMEIEYKRLARQGQMIGHDSLTLANCRQRYHLPEYDCHNALTDAMATAELFLAQANQISRGKELLIKHLM